MTVVFLTACFNKTNEEKMYETLEKVVSLEKTFAAQQDPLVKIEKQEKELYEKIMNLGMKEYDEIVKLSDQALSLLEKRTELIDKEHESIEASKKEFKKLSQPIKKLEDDQLKKLAKKLYDTMIDRYQSYDELYLHYMDSIELDRQLYEMFKDEQLTLEQLEEHVTAINKAYTKILDANKKFNEETDKYNKIKRSFYKESGIEIEDQKNKK